MAAGLARRGLILTMNAAKEQEDLQRRWGAVSCRYVVLHRAEILLQKRALRQRDDEIIPPRMQTTICLGGTFFDLLLSDEQAKLNLNMVFSEKRPRMVDHVLRKSLSGTGGILSTDLHPNPNAVPQKTFPPAFDSWGQVFAYERSRRNRTTGSLPRLICNATTSVTCWGDGKLNVLRAELPVLRQVCYLLISKEGANRFLESRTEHPHWNLDQLLDGTDLRREEKRTIRKWMTDRSSCHSLWILARSGQREWCCLDIGQTFGQSSHPQVMTTWW